MRKEVLISFILVIFLLGNAVGAMASSKYEEIKAYLIKDMKVDLNGQIIEGMKVLNYEGSLYLPARTMSEIAGLNSRLEFDSEENTLRIGGPKYINIYNSVSDNFYQVIVNGNWGATLLTKDRQRVSNYYMGIDISLETIEGLTLETYFVEQFKKRVPYINITKELDTKIHNSPAKIVDYNTKDSIGKIAIINKDSDFVVIQFFVDKTRFNELDFNVFEEIIESFNIQ